MELNVVGLGPAVRGDLEGGRMDVLIGFPPSGQTSLHGRTLIKDHFVALARRQHPALKDGSLSLEDYLAYPHILVTPGGRPGSLVDTALAASGRRRQVAVRVHSFMLAALYLQDSDYLLAMPARAAHCFARFGDIAVTELPLELNELSLSMLWHPRSHRDPAHRWLCALIVELAADEHHGVGGV